LTIADEPYQGGPHRGGHAHSALQWIDDRSGRDRAYRSARRHSLMVKALRWLLPACGIASLVALSLASWVAAPAPYEITVADKYVSFDGIVMEQPTLTGYDKQNRRYRVSADKAVQKITNPNEVRLSDISAEVSMPDKGTATITAGGGDYDNSSALLKLIGGIRVESSLGYQVSLKNADIDLEAGTLVSTNPVTIRYQDSEITGDSMSVSDGGKVIVLEGRVESSLMPPKRNRREKQPAAASGGATGGADAAPGSINDLIQRAEQ
jgi:lipopolysaccharide export system protein LptC